MKREETFKVLSIIIDTFPNIKINDGTLDAWHSLIGDLDFNLALAATKKVLLEQEIPSMPTPGKIRRAADFLLNPDRVTAAEAWEIVLTAIKTWGYSREKSALFTMPKLVEKAVRAVGWRDICLSENIDTVRAQFRRAYEALEKREQELNIMSDDLLKLRDSNVRQLNRGENK